MDERASVHVLDGEDDGVAPAARPAEQHDHAVFDMGD
jgi:hypothetical protein